MVCAGGTKRQIDTATYSLLRKDNYIFDLRSYISSVTITVLNFYEEALFVEV